MSAMHGKKGVGRLTFLKFARLAKWKTVYRNDEGCNYEYEIDISQEILNTYNRTDPVVTENQLKGR